MEENDIVTPNETVEVDYKALYEAETQTKAQIEEELKKAKFTLSKTRVETKNSMSKEEVEEIAKAMADNQVNTLKEEYALKDLDDIARPKVKELMVARLSSIKDPNERVEIAKTLYYAEVTKLQAQAQAHADNKDTTTPHTPSNAQPTTTINVKKLTPAQESYLKMMVDNGRMAKDQANKLRESMLERA